MDSHSIKTALAGVGDPVYIGYPPTGATLPYVVVRPYLVDLPVLTVTGHALVRDEQQAIYCCGASVDASYNLAQLVMQTLQGARVGGGVVDTSMGYVGAAIEGRYETQVTAQAYEGGF